MYGGCLLCPVYPLLAEIAKVTRNFGSLYVSGNLPTYPSPMTTFCPNWEVSVHVVGGQIPRNEQRSLIRNFFCNVKLLLVIKSQYLFLFAVGSVRCRTGSFLGTQTFSKEFLQQLSVSTGYICSTLYFLKRKFSRNYLPMKQLPWSNLYHTGLSVKSLFNLHSLLN